MQRLRTAVVGVAAACLALPLGVGSAAAHDDEDDDALEIEVVARGLDGPRGLAVDRRGKVWVAQAGRGGDGPCMPGPEGGPVCLGATGKISVLQERRGDWRLRDVVTGLPSLAGQGTGENPIGPSDVALERGGRLLATIGLGADPDVRTQAEDLGGLGGSRLARRLGTVQRVDVHRGTTRTLADIARHEKRENPEPVDEDTNPTSIAVGGGTRMVADAGGNALLSVGRRGDVDTVHVFPPEAPAPNPFGPGMIPADAVPDSVVRGPDGAFYVGQLTGFPFTPGTATVWRFAKGAAPTVYADGFTNIMDLAFDDDGDLLVLEISHRGLLSGDPTGALIEVSKKDPARHTVLLTDPLVMPGGIAVDDDDVYISNHSTAPGEGEILRVELDD